MQSFKIIVERHKAGYIAYSLGPKGVVVGEGDTYEDAVADATSAIESDLAVMALSTSLISPVADATSAIEFHIEISGTEAFENKEPDF